MNAIIFIFEIIGTATFAILGGMQAIKKGMDILGTIVLGITTAIGGGVIRDIILGKLPPTSFVHPVYATVAVVFSSLILLPFIRKRILHGKIYDKAMFLLDTFSLGLFTVVGVAVAFDTNSAYNLFLIVFVGVITGVGGGVMRDVFCGEIPYIFRKHIYASASIAGSLICGILWKYLGKELSMLIGFVIVVIIRCLSAHYNWNIQIKKEDD